MYFVLCTSYPSLLKYEIRNTKYASEASFRLRSMSILADPQKAAFATSHPAWTLHEETITRTFTFEDFAEAIGFVTRVGVAAERVFHHPDIDIRWNTVTLTLTSHDVGGLTERDVELAARIDSFVD